MSKVTPTTWAVTTYNQQLSEERGSAVRDDLTKRGMQIGSVATMASYCENFKELPDGIV
jgi:outer membrane protein OmpA-like peptidoglycan-associated protein